MFDPVIIRFEADPFFLPKSYLNGSASLPSFLSLASCYSMHAARGLELD